MNIRFAVLTVSDRSFQGERPDESGPLLVSAVKQRGWLVIHTEILPDDKLSLERMFIAWSGSGAVDVILTTGGTGFSPSDVTPEATQAVVDRLAPGLAEAMRSSSLQTTPHAMLSRGVAGMRNKTLIINLPGSPKAAIENFEVIVPVLDHAVQLIRDDPSAEAGHLTVNG